MISYFFIDRPIFAAVVSIVITLTGAIAVLFLPIAQYPPITPPSVQVSISYPGASAQIVADTIASPVEQQVNGVPGMLYMSSQMGNDGSYTLTVTFDIGVSLNTALVMVQNRVALAMPQLPNEVQRQGITIRKKTPDILMIVNFISPDRRYDGIYLSNFATIYVRDELFRVDGVSDITYLGERDYSIRAWLDPQKLASCNMTATDVANAIRSQNIQAAAGQVGAPPAVGNQSFQLPIHMLGRLNKPEQFGDIIVKVDRGNPAPSLSGATPGIQVAFGMPIPGLGGPGQAAGALTTTRIGANNVGTTALSALTTTGAATTSSSLVGTNAVGTIGTGISGVGTSTVAAPGLSAGTLGPPGIGTSVLSRAAAALGVGTAGTTGLFPRVGTNGLASTSGLLSGGATVGGGATTAGGGTTTGGANTIGGGTTIGGAAGNRTPGQTATQLTTSAAMGTVSGIGVSSSKLPTPSTSIVRLRDVGRVEMGAQQYNMSCTFDGQPSVGLGVRQLPGTNALDVAQRVQAKMDELSKRFPDGVEYRIAYDITPYIRESVRDVLITLFEAVALVGLVVLVFLQNWRAVIVPLVAVPVAIIGTFGVMLVLGFSLNNISLFGLVLAIGIVVDDAIVVVENVERWLDHGLAPREATRKAMDEVTGPVVAVASVLVAVFVPCAFISGITGQFFRQFAVTIAVSTIFSAINSLTLSPALAAILLRPRGARRDPLAWLLNLGAGWFFRLFNAAFGAGTTAYAWSVGKLLRINAVVLLAYGALVLLTFWVFQQAPTGFVPQQDQGRLIASIQAPDSASLERTNAAVAEIEKITRETPGVAHVTTVSGMSFLLQANSSNFASMFIVLDPFDKRRSPHLRDTAIMANLRKRWGQHVKDAMPSVYGAAPIPGLSVVGGFKLMVEDRGGLGLRNLQNQTDNLVQKLKAMPGLTGVSSQFRSNTPQLYMDINRSKVESVGVTIEDVNQTLAIYLGSLYVNSFNAFGRYWQVNVQAEGEYRQRVTDINLLQVRNKWGQMVPLGSLVEVRPVGGPISVTRYNLYTAVPITGNLQSGISSGDAIAGIDALADAELPLSMDTEWTELMFMQLSGPGGAVRKLVAAAGRDPGRAVVPALLGRGGAVHAQLGQHFRADRPGGAGRAGVQERDLDCRVRPSDARRGPLAIRGDGRGVAVAAAAHSDDLVCLHPGGLSPGDRQRRRRRDAPFARNGSLQRHARRDAVWHLPHARFLLRHPRSERDTAVHRGGDAVGRILLPGRIRGPGDRLPAGPDGHRAPALVAGRRWLRRSARGAGCLVANPATVAFRPTRQRTCPTNSGLRRK
jgi:multidrug efflux pump